MNTIAKIILTKKMAKALDYRLGAIKLSAAEFDDLSEVIRRDAERRHEWAIMWASCPDLVPRYREPEKVKPGDMLMGVRLEELK